VSYASGVDEVAAAIADPVRRAILEMLRERSLPARRIAERFPISRPAVSRHLRLLTEAGLAVATDHGRERHYALHREGLGPVATFLRDLAPPAPPVPEHALDALELEVRRTGRERRPAAADPAQPTQPARPDVQEDTA
jgi:DNA-binding transcriptional ArsR family regulator